MDPLLAKEAQCKTKLDPYALLGRMQTLLLEIGAAIAAREVTTLRRKLEDMADLTDRANREADDLKMEDLL